MTVTPNGDEDTSSDGGDTNDADLAGGCNAGGGASWPVMVLVPALVVLRKRRR